MHLQSADILDLDVDKLILWHDKSCFEVRLHESFTVQLSIDAIVLLSEARSAISGSW